MDGSHRLNKPQPGLARPVENVRHLRSVGNKVGLGS